MVNLRAIFEKEEKLRLTTIIALIIIVTIFGAIMFYKVTKPAVVVTPKVTLKNLTLKVDTAYGELPDTAVNVSLYDKDYALIETVKLEPPAFTVKLTYKDGLEDVVFFKPSIPEGYYLAGDYIYDTTLGYIYKMDIENENMTYTILISEISAVEISLESNQTNISNMTETTVTVNGNFSFTAGELRNITIELLWNETDLNTTLNENMNVTYELFSFNETLYDINATDNNGTIILPDLAFAETEELPFMLVFKIKAFVTQERTVTLTIRFTAEGMDPVEAEFTVVIA